VRTPAEEEAMYKQSPRVSFAFFLTLFFCLVVNQPQVSSAAGHSGTSTKLNTLSESDKRKVLDLLHQSSNVDNESIAGPSTNASFERRRSAYEALAKKQMAVKEQLLGIGPKVIPLLIDELSNEHSRATIALPTMRAFGTATVQPLISYIRQGRPATIGIVEALGQVSDQTKPALIDTLTNGTPQAKTSAIRALQMIGPFGIFGDRRGAHGHKEHQDFTTEEVQRICDAAVAAKTSEEKVRLLQLIYSAKFSDAHIAKTLRSLAVAGNSDDVRQRAMSLLGSNKLGADILNDCFLHDKDEKMRASALTDLSGDHKNTAVLPVLRIGLKDKSLYVVSSALQILVDLGPQAAPAIPEIVEILQTDDCGNNTRMAIRALVAMGPAARPALGELEKMVANKNPRYIAAAIPAIASIRGDDYIKEIADYAHNSDVQIRIAAGDGLAVLAKKGSAPANKLIEELKNSSKADDQEIGKQAARLSQPPMPTSYSYISPSHTVRHSLKLPPAARAN